MTRRRLRSRAKRRTRVAGTTLNRESVFPQRRARAHRPLTDVEDRGDAANPPPNASRPEPPTKQASTRKKRFFLFFCFRIAREAKAQKDGRERQTLILSSPHSLSLPPQIVGIDEDLSFDKGFFLTIRAIQLLKKNAAGEPILVGVAGPSGAGKTVFCQKIQAFMPGLCVLSMDMYNDASMLLDGNFDDPRLTDYDLLMENLADLKRGKTVETPVYSFKESKRIGWKTVTCPESKIIVVEGIYALSDKLRSLQDLRVSISGGVHFDLVKRVMRDIDRSGQEPEDIIHQISETVYPMYKAFIEPDLRSAHLRVVNSFNPFAGFQDPTYILKSEVVVDVEAIKRVLDQEGIIETSECETTDIYLLPPHEDPETCTSWLRMRNKDGKYTLMFEETMCDGDVMISPRIKFQVGVRILGGLMALGYEVGAIMKRRSKEWSDDLLSVKIDWIEGLDRSFTQIQGKVRAAVVEAGSKLGLDGTYIPHSYIEQVQYDEMTEELRHMTAEMKDTFVTAANRTNFPPDPIERTASGGYTTGSFNYQGAAMHNASQKNKSHVGQRKQRNESVTRLQDAVRGRGRGGVRSARGSSGGGDADWTVGPFDEPRSNASPRAETPKSPRSYRDSLRAGGRPPLSPNGPFGGLPTAPTAERAASRESRLAARAEEEDRENRGEDGADEARPFGYVSRSASPSPFAEGSFAAGLEVGGVNRLEGRINNLARRVEDVAVSVANARRRDGETRDREDAGAVSAAARVEALLQSHARLQAKFEERQRANEASMRTALAAAAGGAFIAGCFAAAAAYGRGK